MPDGQRIFDALFTGQRPVHHLLQVVLITARDVEHLAQRAGGVLGAKPPRGGQLGVRGDHCRYHHGASQIPPQRIRWVDQLDQSQPFCGTQHCGHMPVPQPAVDARTYRPGPPSTAGASAPASATPPCAQVSATGWPECGSSPCRPGGSFPATGSPAATPDSESAIRRCLVSSTLASDISIYHCLTRRTFQKDTCLHTELRPSTKPPLIFTNKNSDPHYKA